MFRKGLVHICLPYVTALHNCLLLHMVYTYCPGSKHATLRYGQANEKVPWPREWLLLSTMSNWQ